MDRPDAVWLLGRIPHRRPAQPVPRLRHGRTHHGRVDPPAGGCIPTRQLAVNTQPDISHTGNREVVDLSVRAGAWLRSDSILVEEPEQIDALANRPPWLASILEDGYLRRYDARTPGYLPLDAAGVNLLELSMLHVLDLGANYWSLWTEAAELDEYNKRYPRGFARLRQRMGYRVRPSWIWQRKRYGVNELVVAFMNDGVAGVPGVLCISLKSADGKMLGSGCLDAGQPYGGKTRQAAFLVPRELEGQPVFLSAAIECKAGLRRPVQWACEQPSSRTAPTALWSRSNPTATGARESKAAAPDAARFSKSTYHGLLPAPQRCRKGAGSTLRMLIRKEEALEYHAPNRRARSPSHPRNRAARSAT